jgi:hypothetical protein
MRATGALGWVLAAAAATLAGAACGRSRFEGGGDLRAKRVVLEREVEGLREVAARLERGEPFLPSDDVVISIDAALVRELIVAQLPFDMDVDRLHLRLSEAVVLFRGSPVVKLRGSLVYRERPEYEGAIAATGALEDIDIDSSTSTLRSAIAIDHITIERAGGLETFLSRSALDEAARAVRLRLAGQLPTIQIPVKLRQRVELPAVTHGPVRIDGAAMPIQVSVSQVTAGRDELWIAVHFVPGELTKTNDAPEAGDTRAGDVDVSLDDDGGGGGKPRKEAGR